MIVIVDYGMGNLHSVAKAFEHLGYACRIADKPQDVAAAEKLVLPGVGAFCDAMAALNETRLAEPIREHLGSGKPFFGICLGLQLLFTRSFEDGEHLGLGIFEGDVVRLNVSKPLKVPHMGWNQLEVVRAAPALEGMPAGSMAYFVHSYHVVPTDPNLVAVRSDHGGPFVAAIWRDNIFATQFHPEKSQKIGLRMLENFARM